MKKLICILILLSTNLYSENTITYQVEKGDTLFSISQKFDIGLEQLKSINNLENNTIYLEQELKIINQKIYVVKKGDTLFSIAKANDIKLEDLKKKNGLEDNNIFPGDILYLVEKTEDKYIVQEGDSLWEIANKYELSIKDIKNANNLKNMNIYSGQSLTLNINNKRESKNNKKDNDKTKTNLKSKPKINKNKYVKYFVSKGETLSEIARLHNMSLKEIKTINNLENNKINYGNELKVLPLGFSFEMEKTRDLFFDNIKISKANTKFNGDSYYFHTPRYQYQKNSEYFESAFTTHKRLYNKANFLIEELDKVIKKLPKLSNKLEGWKIVVDPGHGGIDPGVVVTGKNANGHFHIMEDEYVYDISLRIYILLKLHGADAIMTVLSPNHLTRNSIKTFVNEKNEVYNEKYLYSNKFKLPSGHKSNIKNRTMIAKNYFGNQKDKTLFMSIHADKTFYAPAASSIWYLQKEIGTDVFSKKVAEDMKPYLGANSYIKGEELIVLNGNNTGKLKLLIEVKNLEYKSHVWEIKQAKLRQKDAEKIVLGLLNTTNN
ncbi:MAG: LysM peptidoglycan-binding domain-containing protein [Fusobacteriota bacterium]